MLDWLPDLVFGSMTKEQRSFLVRAAWIGLVSFHMLWVCGWIGFTGMTAPFARADELSKITDQLKGFARAEDLKNTTVVLQSIQDQLKQDRIERLEHDLLQIRASQCRAAVATPARSQYTDRLNEIFRQYQLLAGRDPYVPRCDET